MPFENYFLKNYTRKVSISDFLSPKRREVVMRKKTDTLVPKERLVLAVCLLVTGLLLLSPGKTRAQVAFIDHFTDHQSRRTVNAGTPNQTWNVTGVMMGGVRWIDLNYTAGPNNVDASSAYHNLFFSSETQTTANMLVRWNGSAGNFENLSLAQNFSIYDRFVLHITSDDLGAANSQLRVYSSAADWSVATFIIPQVVIFPGIDLEIPFSAFAVGGGSGVNWANVQRVDLYVPGQGDLDLTIDSLQIRGSSAFTNPPDNPMRLIFIHHSTGENWLSDDNGRLGVTLRDNNYFVSDTNYGWGAGQIGSTTDIGHWWLWFRGPDSGNIMQALYAESNQNCPYSRMPGTAPGLENDVILFKSCFPNSALKGSPADPVPSIDQNPLRGQDSSSPYHTVANAKGIYIDLLEYFRTRQDKLFIAIAAPPLSDPTYASNARSLNEWLVNDWLKDYPYNNVAVFDFYNVLTTNGGSSSINDLGQETGNHHRWWSTSAVLESLPPTIWVHKAIQHTTNGDDDSNPDVLEYPSSTDDDHPSTAGNLKATGEFPLLLNIFYHCWKGTGGCPDETPPFSVVPRSYNFGSLHFGNSSTLQTFAIVNTGGEPLAISAVGITGQNADQFFEAYNGCSHQIVEPTGNCRVDVAFSPTSAGAKRASLNITASDPRKLDVAVQLSGTGVSPISITVVSPNGGEYWKRGTRQTIKWKYTESVGSYVKIQLIQGSTVSRTITNRTPIGTNKAGSFSWLLPSNLTPGSNYKVRVTSTANSNYRDDSDANFNVRR
jgi:hypothetical protein